VHERRVVLLERAGVAKPELLTVNVELLDGESRSLPAMSVGVTSASFACSASGRGFWSTSAMNS